MKPDGQIIFVREYLQTYIARCCGKTASCSGSAEGAARAVARKWMGKTPHEIRKLRTPGGFQIVPVANAPADVRRSCSLQPDVGRADPCCGTAPVWFRWPSGRWAVQCAVCRRRGGDTPNQSEAIRFWNAELQAANSVPSYPPNKGVTGAR